MTSGGTIGGTSGGPDERRIRERAGDLLPEELAAGTADPDAQAAAILADSDERQDDAGAGPDGAREHRHSEDTVDPPA